jgi:hypothetical protein
MIRTMIRTGLALVILALLPSARPALADPPVAFRVSGDGVFNPANIGTPKGGNAGVVLGDGSGLSAYIASGEDFVLGNVDLGAVGLCFNNHLGANQSRTTGTLHNGIITWPLRVAPNPYVDGSPEIHVTQTLLGDIYFQYPGSYTLDPATGAITGDGNFVVVGGTGLFEKVSGLVLVHVNATGANPSGGVKFHYEFDGFISLKD